MLLCELVAPQVPFGVVPLHPRYGVPEGQCNPAIDSTFTGQFSQIKLAWAGRIRAGVKGHSTFLNFFPLPRGHGSLRPIFCLVPVVTAIPRFACLPASASSRLGAT